MLYWKVRPSSTLEILPEFMWPSIFLKSGSFMNLQCEFTLYSRPLIDVSIYSLKLHIWSITHIPPEPVLTLWHRRNAGDGGRQHLSWIWRPVKLQRHTPPPPLQLQTPTTLRQDVVSLWRDEPVDGGTPYSPSRPTQTHVGPLSTSSKSRWSKPKGSGACLASRR